MARCCAGRCLWVLLAVVAAAWGAVPTGMDMPLLKLLTSGRQENHAISPFLLSNVMSQIWLGAGGKTRDEMTAVLGLSGAEDSDFLSGYSSARNALSKQNTNVTTAIFNRIYIRQGFSVKPTFTNLLQQYYGVSEQIFASDQAAANDINSAVASVTRNRIRDIVTADTLQNSKLVLVGALYFKGMWETKFDVAKPGMFLTPEGDQRVPMMKLDRKLAYGTFGDFDVVKLPYQDPDYSLLVLRPAARTLAAFDKLHSSLESLDISDMYNKLSFRDVIVRMPRFKIETTYSLSEPMQQLGMRELFSGSANLSGISDIPLAVDKVIHKVFMEVNEEGTEAAAAVAVTFLATSVQIPMPPVQFTVDRPFFAVLYHIREKINLFSAMVVKP